MVRGVEKCPQEAVLDCPKRGVEAKREALNRVLESRVEGRAPAKTVERLADGW